jgi:hypothetical protein
MVPLQRALVVLLESLLCAIGSTSRVVGLAPADSPELSRTGSERLWGACS